MVIVVDTTVLLDNLRGHPAAIEAVASALQDGRRTLASVISKSEVMAGMRTHERRAVRNLFGRLEWASVDEIIAELAGEYGRHYRRSHNGIDVPDLLIAATATRLHAEMWTSNIKHFPMFEDLRPPY